MVTYSPILPGDLEKVLQLQAKRIASLEQIKANPGESSRRGFLLGGLSREEMAEAINKQTVLLGDIAGEIVGYILAYNFEGIYKANMPSKYNWPTEITRWLGRHKEDVRYIRQIVTDPEARGIGPELMTAYLDHEGMIGIGHFLAVTMAAPVENKASAKLLRGFGFENRVDMASQGNIWHFWMKEPRSR
ncbi:MAG: GNAT family N-acetyltransferase [Dongiaceae bacterium]